MKTASDECVGCRSHRLTRGALGNVVQRCCWCAFCVVVAVWARAEAPPAYTGEVGGRPRKRDIERSRPVSNQPAQLAPRDHVCGGGIPDCAACCLPGGCTEVSRTDCVVMFGGNPQDPGSDCHDFNGNGTADACEPEFPLCLPSNDQLSCDGQCPGPLPCNATKVRVNLTTFEYEVLECGCRSCRVCLECDAFPPPCVQDCAVGSACARTEMCYGEICDIACNCAEQGAWDLPFDWGLPGELVVPIHASVVPVRDGSGRLRGQVFAHDDHVEGNHLHTYLWDPETATFTQYELPVLDVMRDCPTPPPPAEGNLFCSGHSLLSDGKLLITGGHIVAAGLFCSNGYAFSGHDSAHTFDALAAGSGDPWNRVQDMRQGRWYPTNCTLADGRILTASGFDSCGYCDGTGFPVSTVNTDVEIYAPPSAFSAGAWSLAGQQYFPLYPWFHLLSNGSIFYSGPGTDSRLSNPPYGSWSVFAYSMLFPFRGAGTSVLLPGRPDSVMILGGGCTGCGPYPSTTDTTEITDVFSLAPPHWYPGPTMNRARRHLNAVLLPDGTVLAVGGRSDGEDPGEPVLPVYEAELYDPLGPANQGWQIMAAMARPRMYHSTALLLPDGRVLSAGGTYVNPSFPSETNAEIYSPPYLFRGPRPVIMAAPENVTYGQEFSVLTPSPTDISSVVLMRPGSVTHSVNMEQRHVPLQFQLSTLPEGLLVTAPANGNLAPPGYYMLFILNGQRVPSEAVILHLGADEACCSATAAGACQNIPPADCTAQGGTPLGPGAMCQGTGSCCYDITDDLCLFDTCLDQDGACCAANGGVFQGVGSTCGIEACCIDGLCCDLDADCCVISGGVPAGPGTSCAHVEGACCYDGDGDSIPEVCIITDATCCADLNGYFHGAGTTCSPNVGACCFGIVFGMCHDNINETCCLAIEAGLFVGDGTFCLGDGNGNGFDDACETALCTPNPAGNACNPTQCPNNQEVCLPTKIKCTPSGAACTIIDCACQDPNRCHIDFPHGSPIPACLGGCPLGEECREIITIDADGQFLHMCMCVSPEACCLNADITCQMRLPSDCLAIGGTPQGPGSTCLGHEACCLPDGSCTFVDAVCCDDLGGTPQGSGSMCPGIAPGPCCYDITDDFCIYDTCVDGQDPLCCAASGGVPTGDDGTCGSEACCIDGLCCDISPACCVISGGVAGGPGSSCAGVQGACCYDGDGDGINEVCIIADAACCSDVGGFFHGPGTTCSPSFGACCFGFTGGSCIEMNESCCGDLEAGTFLGNGSVCLGDGNGNGLDDACDSNACAPNPTGLDCRQGQCLPNESCRPSKIRRNVDGDHRIIDCECTPFGANCHVELNPDNPIFGQPVCFGVCPPGQVCELVSSGAIDGTIDYMCICRDENMPIPCGPDAANDACFGACPPNFACVPTVIRRDPLNPGFNAVVACDCRIPDLCRTALDNSGDPICPGFCPGPIACNPYTVPTPAFQELLQCACFTEGCCFPSGGCQNLPPELCRAAGGEPQGSGPGCTARAPCCTPAGRCHMVDPLCCDELGGTVTPGMVCVMYGDITPKPDGDGFVDVGDVLKMLDGFSDPSLCPQCDIAPCCGDGFIDVGDVLAVLDAFAGDPRCPDLPCPCDGP